MSKTQEVPNKTEGKTFSDTENGLLSKMHKAFGVKATRGEVTRKMIREFMTAETGSPSGYGFITRNPVYRSSHGMYTLPKPTGRVKNANAAKAAKPAAGDTPREPSMTKDAIRKRAVALAKKNANTPKEGANA